MDILLAYSELRLKVSNVLVCGGTRCHKMVKYVEVMDAWLAVTTAWRVLRFRMEERPPDMECSCEYIE